MRTETLPATHISSRALAPISVVRIERNARTAPRAGREPLTPRRLVAPLLVMLAVTALDLVTKLDARALASHLAMFYGFNFYDVDTSAMPLSTVVLALLPLLAGLALRSRVTTMSAALIAGGALGNFVWAGRVPNWLLIPHVFPFTALSGPWLHAADVCNFADICLFAGTVVFMPAFSLSLVARASACRRH